jgi:hypothetical protein
VGQASVLPRIDVADSREAFGRHPEQHSNIMAFQQNPQSTLAEPNVDCLHPDRLADGERLAKMSAKNRREIERPSMATNANGPF